MSEDQFNPDLFDQMLADLGVDVSEDALAQMPEPGAAYPAGMWIAPWRARFGYWFMAQEDPNDVEDEEFVKPDLFKEQGEWYHYYYFDLEPAKVVHDQLVNDPSFKPQECWIFWTQKADVVNRDSETLKDFSDILITESLIKSLLEGGGMSMVNRHQFNLVSQPCGVAAVAKYLGMGLSFNIDELLHYNEVKFEQGSNFDAESFFIELCGDPDGRYQESTLWKRRVKLWKALGEEDATKTANMLTKTSTGSESPYATSSVPLSNCIGFAQGTWNKPIWCRVAFVPNPNPSKVSSTSGRPYTFPALIEIFKSEEEARKVGASEIEEMTGHPPVPDNWASAGVEKWLKELKKALGGEVPNVGKAARVAADPLYCTAEEVIAWANHLSEQGEL